MLGAVATLLGVPQGIVEAVVTPEVRNGVILDAYDISSNYESWTLQLSRVLVCCSTAQCWCCSGVVAVEGGQYRVKLAPRLTTEPDEMQHHIKLC